MTNSVEYEVIRAIARQKRLDPDQIHCTSILEKLGITSLDAITIVYDVEEIFDVEIDNDKLGELVSVQDIIDGVTQLIEAKG
ncbi:MAG: histidine kinase [Gammaproteobacteria bacterium]|nr:histidine kinase [Gammaproteobacteria bacterium]